MSARSHPSSAPAAPAAARSSAGRPSARGTSLAVVAGGAVGALLRFALDETLPLRPGQWPWATFIANVAGAALLGALAARLSGPAPRSARLRALLGTGLCGALTTFSSMHVQAIGLARDGHAPLAALYVGASIGAGLVCVALAAALVRPRVP